MSVSDSASVTRRAFLVGSGAALVAACSSSNEASPTSTAAPTAAPTNPSTTTVVLPSTTVAEQPLATLRMLVPPESIAQAAIERFATEQNAAVVIEVYSDNGFVIDRLLSQSGDYQYDLVVVPGAFLPLAIADGLVQELDVSLIPSREGQLESVQVSPFDPDGRYSVGKEVGYTGYAWNREVIPEGIASWDEFLQAAARPDVSGKVTALREGAEVAAISAWSTGVRTGAGFDVAAAEADLRGRLLPHLADLDSGASIRIAEGSIVLAQMWNGEGRRLVQTNPDKFGYAIGGPVTGVWMERYVVPANATSATLAHAFIELMLQPDVSLAEVDRRGYNTGLAAIQDQVQGLANGDLIPTGDAMFGDARDYGEALLAASFDDLEQLVVGVIRDLLGTGATPEVPTSTVPATPASTTPDTTPAEAPTTTVQVDSQGRRVLRPQDTGPEVEQLQRRLIELGFSIGRADGWYGDVTLAAVLAFQRSQGLQTDGVVGRYTWDALANPKPIDFTVVNTRGVSPNAPSDATGHASPAADNRGRTWVKAVIYLDSFRDEFFDSQGNKVGGFPNSPGVNGLTPTGTFKVYSRSADTFYSRNPAETMKWMVRFNGGVGFHSVPRINGVPEPTPLGQAPSSHGCIRHADDVAKIIYDNLADGATVIVQHG